MRDIFISQLLERAHRDPRIMLLTGDLGFKVFDQFQQELPKQFLNVGVAEQNMSGVAAGLALDGFVVFTYSIANFSTLRCLEQIRNDICYHNANVTVVAVGGGFSYGQLGFSHHATEDLSIMRALPNMRVLAPCDDWEAAQATNHLIEQPSPSYLRLDRTSSNSAETCGAEFKIGRARVLRQGRDVTLIASGGIVQEILKAQEILCLRGFSVRVISFHTLRPIDVDALKSAANETGGIVTVEENVLEGGLGSLVAETLLESGVFPRFFVRLGIRDGFVSKVGDQQYLRKQCGIDAAAIVERTQDAMCSSKERIRRVGNFD